MSSASAPAISPQRGWQVERPAGRCGVCGRVIEPGDRYVAALRATAEGFERVDADESCWEQVEKQDLIGDWRAVMPEANERPKRFVDDPLLLEMFHRLADAEDPARLNFRFVLGLLLMRKRLLTYQTSRAENGREVWVMKARGSDEPSEMVNPDLTDEQVSEVTRQLGEVLNEDGSE